MATGYESRQPTRNSFAAGSASPVQLPSTRGGQSAGAQLYGRGATSEVGLIGPQTDVAPGGGALPAFFEQMLQPIVERKQSEAAIKGAVAVHNGRAQEDIEKSQGTLGRIFGPSGFVEGARAFTASRTVADGFNKMQEDLPELRKLPEADFAKVMNDRLNAMLTGNAAVNAAVQHGFLEKIGSFTNTVAKARREYEEETAVSEQAANTDSHATFFENTARAQVGLTPDQVDGSAVIAAEGAFLRSLQRPEGMSDDAYRQSIFTRSMLMLSTGKLRSFAALKRAGVLAPGQVFNDEQIARLEMAELRSNERANEELARDPWVIEQIAALHADTADNRIKAPLDAQARLAAVNDYVTARTGGTLPLYDAKAVISAVNAVTDAQLGARREAERRQQAIADRNAEWAHAEWVKDRDRAQAAAQASSAFATGDVAYSLAKGLGSSEDYDSFAASAWASSDMGSLARAFNGVRGRGGGWVSGKVAGMAQSMISAFGEKYTPAFQDGYKRWKALDQASPGAAARYFGRYNLRLKAFDGLVSDGVPAAIAYERSFVTPGAFDMGNVDPVRRKALAAALDSAVSSMSPSTLNPFSWGKWSLARSSATLIKGVIGGEAAAYLAHTGMSPEAVVGMTAQSAQAAGHFETAGRLAWRNDEAGIKPLARVLGAQDGEFATAFMELADQRLKAAGFTQGAYAEDYTVHRFGNEGVYVLGVSEDGSQHEGVLISVPELRAKIDKRAKDEITGNHPDTKPLRRHPVNHRMRSFSNIMKRK